MLNLHAFATLFAYDFMRNAFIAGSIAAVVSSCVGYFMVLRNLSFAGHALGHIGFTGAAGAGLVNLSPLGGQLLLSLLAAGSMGMLGEHIQKSDRIIGIILAFALGLGMLFLYFYTNYAGQATAILFGDLLGVATSTLYWMGLFAIASLIALAVIARPLLFSSLEPELAAAKGVPMTAIATIFLLIMAVAVTQASQIVGILLVFTLLVGPPAAAINWTKQFWSGLGLSLVLGVGMVWTGILLAYWSDWPIAFWLSALSLGIYLASSISRKYIL